MSREARLLFEDIAEACEDVARMVTDVDYETFSGSVEKLAAVERKVFVIGEAAARLPDEVRDGNPHIPWHLIIGMRNILAHAYWRIDRKVLWDAATRAVPALLANVNAILRRAPAGDS